MRTKKIHLGLLVTTFLGIFSVLISISPKVLAENPVTPTPSNPTQPTSIPTLKVPPTPSHTPSLSGSVKPTKTASPTPIPTLRAFNGPPALTAMSAIAIDADTGKILFAKDPSRQLPEASTTKIMTALTLLAIPGVSLDEYTVVQKADLVGEASMDLHTGTRIKVLDLLYGMLLDSANDAATALARYGGDKLPGEGDGVDKFVKEMNEQAGKMGLWNTHFVNPHGLDEPGHYTSAEDLAIAGWYASQNPVISAIVKQNAGQLDGFWFANISNFIRRYPGATGIKPGQTDEAGLCLVASATRFGHNAIVVLLNSPELATESDVLMDYAFTQMMAGDLSLNSNNTNSVATQEYYPSYIGYPTSDKKLLQTSANIETGIVHAVFQIGQILLQRPFTLNQP